MADNNSAKVYNMSLPPDMDDENPPVTGQGGGGSRPRRKKKVDSGKLKTLFRNWALQYCTQIAWDTETRKPYAIAGLRNQFGNDEVKMWLSSDKRRCVHEEQIVFDPSRKAGPECINLYGGLDMVPIAGNCQPIKDLLLHLVADDFTVYDWILDWIAYPLQNPGAKLPTSVIMHGDEGSGKNLFWEVVRDIYGEYGTIVGQDQLEDKFNDWLSRQLFIIGDEVLSRQEMRHLKGKLKAMISGKEIKINTKMMPVRSEANHVNLVFLSNELQPNALDASDRRYCVVWTPPKLGLDFYRAVAQCRDKGGKEAFLHDMLARDLSKFDPFAPPPGTSAKNDLIDLGRPNPERWFLAWSAGDLAVPYHSCSSEQGFRFYVRWCKAEGERNSFSRNYFSRTVMRLAADKLSNPVMKLGSKGVATRMWLVTPPPEGVDLGVFAKECVDAFEGQLKDYATDSINKS